MRSEKILRIVKYLISGGSAAAVDLGLLYVFVSMFHMGHIVASALAFICAFGVSFSLQKFWTFNNRSVENIHGQMGMYFVVAIFNLALNTFLMYLFVDFGHLHYLVAQILAAGLIAIESFFAYKKIIFKIPE